MVMIKRNLQAISLKEIDIDDHAYRYSFLSCESLKASIKQIGLVNPIIVQKKAPSSYRIVCGFRRIAALAELKIDACPAFVLQHSGVDLDVFLMAIQENQSHRSLNPVELSIILDKLQNTFEIDQQDIIKTYLPRLGYGKNPRVLQLYSGLHQLSREWQDALANDQVAVDFVQDILKLSGDVREKFYQLVAALRLGKNRQREFLQLFQDVAKLESISLSQLLLAQDVLDIQQHETLTPSQKAERLKEWLWKKRYPRYSSAKSEFDSEIKTANLPRNVYFQPPPYFEGDTFSTGFTFTSENEFAEHVAALQKILNDGTLKKIMDIT